MFKLMRRTTLTSMIALVVAATGLTAASAQAKSLVLSRPGLGPIPSVDATMTTTGGSVALEGDECGTSYPGILKWRLKVNQFGNGYTGSITGLNSFQCSLPSGAGVTIEPDPHPWSVKLTPAGKFLVKGEGQKIEMIAQLADEECVYATGKINMIFIVEGPLRPVPLEPGDPAIIKYKLVKNISGANCPKTAGEQLKFDVTAEGGPAGEEQVYDEA